MQRILRPIIIVPALIGIISSFLILLTIRKGGKETSLFKDSSVPSSALPRGRMINLQTNQDDYEKLMKGKVLLVFLTRGCDACQKEIPNIAAALPSLTPRMAVYGVYVEERSEVASFVQENQITFPVLLDSGGRIFAGLGITLIPAKVLLEDGKITKKWFGSSPSKSALIKDVGEEDNEKSSLIESGNSFVSYRRQRARQSAGEDASFSGNPEGCDRQSHFEDTWDQ